MVHDDIKICRKSSFSVMFDIGSLVRVKEVVDK